MCFCFFFSSRRRHTRCGRDWSSDVCSSDLGDRPRPPRGGDLPGLTQYSYRDAMSGFFEFPTENARRILPPNLEPVEVHHGTSVFALTAFDFNQSEVGAYGEVVMAVVVAP